MKLYWAPRTRSFSALWILEEIGAPYERELIDIRRGDQDKPAYRAINPMGKVPALVDGAAVVAEQGAICAWLADRFPEAGLAPTVADPLRGSYLRWLFFAGNCIEPAYLGRKPVGAITSWWSRCWIGPSPKDRGSWASASAPQTS